MQRRVIVADHDPAFRDAVTNALRQRGYEVVAISVSDELVSELRARRPDLLIWSTAMEMDSFKALDIWRPSSPVASIPQILIGVRSADSCGSGILALAHDTPAPLLFGRKPMEPAVVGDAALSIVPIE